MVLCSAAPGVLANLVVVDGGDKGMARVQQLKVRITAVLRVAPAVVGERYGGPGLLHRASDGRADALLGLVRVLIEVVAQMEDQVEVVARSAIRA